MLCRHSHLKTGKWRLSRGTWAVTETFRDPARVRTPEVIETGWERVTWEREMEREREERMLASCKLSSRGKNGEREMKVSSSESQTAPTMCPTDGLFQHFNTNFCPRSWSLPAGNTQQTVLYLLLHFLHNVFILTGNSNHIKEGFKEHTRVSAGFCSFTFRSYMELK